MPRVRPPLPNQRPERTRVIVGDGKHLYVGGSHAPVRAGQAIDLPPDHAADLIAKGHVETPEARAERLEKATQAATAAKPPVTSSTVSSGTGTLSSAGTITSSATVTSGGSAV